MSLKIDPKFEGKLAFSSKNYIRNLANFFQSIWKSQTWVFDDIFLSKFEYLWASNLQGSYVSWQGKWCKKWLGIDLAVQNWHEEFEEFWPEKSKIPKLCTLMGWFWPQYTIFELKENRGVMFHSTEYWFVLSKIIRGILQIFTKACLNVANMELW